MNWKFFRTHLFSRLPLEEIVNELRDFDQRFRLITRKHIAVLGFWAVLNVLIGLPAIFLWDGAIQYFFMMNITWGLINYGVTYWIYDHSIYRKFTKGDSFERFEAQRHVEKFMLFNLGLDIAYVCAGLYLKSLAYTCDGAFPDLWTGFGWSVLFQGAYLFVQDNVFHFLHMKNFKKAKPFLMKLLEER